MELAEIVYDIQQLTEAEARQDTNTNQMSSQRKRSKQVESPHRANIQPRKFLLQQQNTDGDTNKMDLASDKKTNQIPRRKTRTQKREIQATQNHSTKADYNQSINRLFAINRQSVRAS